MYGVKLEVSNAFVSLLDYLRYFIILTLNGLLTLNDPRFLMTLNGPLGVIQGQNNRGSFRVIGSLRIINWVVIQGKLGLQLTANCFGLPVRVSGTNLALARVRSWAKGLIT